MMTDFPGLQGAEFPSEDTINLPDNESTPRFMEPGSSLPYSHTH
jgi:hypothetical protein